MEERHRETFVPLSSIALRVSCDMAHPPLMRSYKRKYRKIHAGFSRAQGVANVLQADLDAAVATALKLGSETDFLLQLLHDTVPKKSIESVEDQLQRLSDTKDGDDTVLDDAGSDEGEDYYTTSKPPAHFDSMPWDMDMKSFSGSHLGDIDNASVAVTSGSALIYMEPKVSQSTTTASNSNKKVKGSSSKKRDRNDEDTDLHETPSGGAKKKKRKSLLSRDVSNWE